MKLFFYFSLFFVGREILSEEYSLQYFKNNVFFYFYYENKIIYNTSSFTENISDIKGCTVGKPWLILVHGFTQSCETTWVPDAVSNFTIHRGGCIVCMDYSKFSGQHQINLFGAYLNLMATFSELVGILVKKLQQFERQNFSYDLGYMFGQSFGSQIMLEAGKRINGQLYGIDACEPAGPLFYPRSILNNNKKIPNYLAAKNVQCIHTSGTFGTLQRNCDQDWIMGECGLNQKASHNIIWGDHSLCPVFYNTAFRLNYTAVNNVCCRSSRRVNLTELPEGYRMGYLQINKGIVKRKDLYSLTFGQYPYNSYTKPGKENFISKIFNLF